MSDRLLLIEDTATLQLIYSTNLRNAGYSVDVASSGGEGIDIFIDNSNPVVILDLFLPDMDGVDLIRRLVAENPYAKIIVITSNGSVKHAVDAMRAGAYDFLLKPFSDERLFATVEAALKNVQGRTKMNLSKGNFYGFIGRSPAMQDLYREIIRVADSKAPVFISGEQGTGKTLCAQAIHDHSGPRSRPFVKYSGLHSDAETQDAMLFGSYGKGGNGAHEEKKAAFEQAFGGTLYLSDISSLDPFVQSKLATILSQSLQDKTDDDFPRMICSSYSEPYHLLEQNKIREDLFYQLHVLTVELPAFRDLEDDIAYIAETLLQRFSAVEHKIFTHLSYEVLDVFKRHNWPGNLSQLQNLLRTCVASYEGQYLTLDMLPIGFTSASRNSALGASDKTDDPFFVERSDNAIQQLVGLDLDEVERKFIEATIKTHGGSIPRAAEALGVAPSTIYRKRSKS